MPQLQKFHTDDVNQCLHNKSGSHGVPNAGRVLCSSAKAIQQISNAFSREEYIPQIFTILLNILCHQYAISVAEAQTSSPSETSQAARSEEKLLFSQANVQSILFSLMVTFTVLLFLSWAISWYRRKIFHCHWGLFPSRR